MAYHREHLAAEQAADIIRNCRTSKDDGRFALKYGVGDGSVRDIRLGVAWWRLRREIEGKRRG